jgi:hypothetical protein
LSAQLDLTEDYSNMEIEMEYEDDDWDNVSVASLAVPMGQSSNTENASPKSDGKSSGDKDSPEALVSEKNRKVVCMQRTFLFLLVAAGIGLSVGAYFFEKEDDEGAGEDQDDDEDEEDGFLYAGVIPAVFFVLVLVFLRYNFLVSDRQSLVLDMAKRSRHIVDSLFPSLVRDRLMREAVVDGNGSISSRQSDGEGHGEVDFAKLTKMNTMANKSMADFSCSTLPFAPFTESPTRSPTKVKKYLAVGVESKEFVAEDRGGKPIADLYPSATVFFADIAGFTAWSAERDPTQVFTLLEKVYNEFDSLADQLKVFKVSARCAESDWHIAYWAPAWQSSHSTT